MINWLRWSKCCFEWIVTSEHNFDDRILDHVWFPCDHLTAAPTVYSVTPVSIFLVPNMTHSGLPIHCTNTHTTVCAFVIVCVKDNHQLHQFNLRLFFFHLSQMFMSRTSVGVVERSCSSTVFLVSIVTEFCCCACLRLVSNSDSICSWHARRQSWRQDSWGRCEKSGGLCSARVNLTCSRVTGRWTYRVTPDGLCKLLCQFLRHQGISHHFHL